MRIINYFIISTIIVFTVIACKEPYEPDIISSDNSYLVVEGVLNAGSGPTSIRLSRTFKLDDTARLRGEQNASVMVEGKDNIIRQLTMTADGIYTSPDLGLALNQEYRLKIITANGKEYLSDYVVAKKTPPIDSIGFVRNEKGVQIHASTHDNSNNTRYYLWDYDETWEIRTFYYSSYKYENGVVLPRDPILDDVSTCWKYGKSSNILIGSSASFQTDAIYRAPIAFFNNGDEKLAVRYSILLRQYALNKKGYEFYEMMKKNTESLGSIFDAQPSEIRGNIRCTGDPYEPVIGYISASDAEEKRIFITQAQLGGWIFRQNCESYNIANHPDSIAAAYGTGLSIYSAIMMGPFITGYNVSSLPCVDCRKRGGSLIKPSYW